MERYTKEYRKQIDGAKGALAAEGVKKIYKEIGFVDEQRSDTL